MAMVIYNIFNYRALDVRGQMLVEAFYRHPTSEYSFCMISINHVEHRDALTRARGGDDGRFDGGNCYEIFRRR